MSLIQGRKSPVNFVEQGRRSPLLLLHDRMRSPNDPPTNGGFMDARSPTRSPTTDRRSPTLSVHDRRSPVNLMNDQYQRQRSPTTVHVQDVRGFEMEEIIQEEERSDGYSSFKRTSISLFTPIPMGEKRSPLLSMPIPPITVSNPVETCKIVERMAASHKQSSPSTIEQPKSIEIPKSEKQTPDSLSSDKEHSQSQQQPEKKERTSVMKEILAFVRKPSKRISTRTGSRFAAAFTRAESGSGSGPLIRQSTFSTSPAASSNAAKTAVTKQMSEVGFEPKMSLKFGLNTKMSLKLRRSAANDDPKKKDKKSSGDEASGTESDSKSEKVGQKKICKSDRCSIRKKEQIPFELANVHFEKVGDSYIKHDQPLKEEDYINGNSTLKQKIVALSNENAQNNSLGNEQNNSDLMNGIDISNNCGNRVVKASSRDFQQRISEEQESDPIDSIDQFKAELEQYLQPIKPEPIYVNLMEMRNELGISTSTESIKPTPLQCPIIEFEPPSRRSSFDPPRSPYLENLRSPGVDTDRSGGDSFEMVDSGDRNRESSFEGPYSSRDTSFDISRYQSTSYEDQTSSFEIVDIDPNRTTDDKKSTIDLRKSSIELVDAETFKERSSSTSGRKSSLETHFDYLPTDHSNHSNYSGKPSPSIFPCGKKQKPDHFRSREIHISPFSAFSRARSPLSNQTSSNYSSRDSYDSSSSHQYPSSHCESSQKSPFADHTKQHFPLTVKTDNDDVIKQTFLCTDKRCSSIFEPRQSIPTAIPITTAPIIATQTPSSSTSSATYLSCTGLNVTSHPVTSPCHISVPNNNTLMARSLSRSGCMSALEFAEFEPPSPRRAASASPKHTFTFRIVLKKVDSSPDAICPSAERRSRNLDRHKKHRDSRRHRLSNAGKSF